MRRITDIAVLCSGKSLGRLPEIADKFDTCFIVNLWQNEGPLLRQYLENKDITYMLNADQRLWVKEKLGGIKANKAVLSWTKSIQTDPTTAKRDVGSIVKFFRTVMKVSYLPEKYREVVLQMRNSGVLCVRFVAEELKPDTLWIVGLDFYCCDYFRKAGKPVLTEHQINKVSHGWTERLAGYFLDTVRKFPDIQFKMVTEYKKLPKLSNLEIL